MSDRIIGSVEDAIYTRISDWLADHRLVYWLVSHPVVALILLAIGLVLFLGLLGAIARSSEQFWLVLLKAPFQLVGWLVRTSFWAVGKTVPAFLGAKAERDRQTRLQELTKRLEAIRKEQDALLQEVQALLTVKDGR